MRLSVTPPVFRSCGGFGQAYIAREIKRDPDAELISLVILQVLM